MTYPYPIPGTTTLSPVVSGPYFGVGNNCCDGGMSNDVNAKTKVVFDYTNELPTGVNVTSVNYNVTPVDFNTLAVTDQTLVNNIATFMVSNGLVNGFYVVQAIAELTDGQIWVDKITVIVTSCDTLLPVNQTPITPPGAVIISNTLYYNATAAQTVIILSTPDKFGRTGTLIDNNVLVYANGSRLLPSDSYILDIPNNQIIFSWPLGVGESVAIDIATSVTSIPPPTVSALNYTAIKTEVLTISVANILPQLMFPPDGIVLILFVNGTPFFATGPFPGFTYTGRNLVWTSTLYSVPIGAAVIAVYTHG